MKSRSRQDSRKQRHARLRKKVKGTAERPRMSIMISNRNMYVQFIDDDAGLTVASAASLGGGARNTVASATALGRRAAESALGKGISRVVVDRGGFRFHGRVKAIVDGALEAGLSTGNTGRTDATAPVAVPSDETENGKEAK